MLDHARKQTYKEGFLFSIMEPRLLTGTLPPVETNRKTTIPMFQEIYIKSLTELSPLNANGHLGNISLLGLNKDKTK